VAFVWVAAALVAANLFSMSSPLSRRVFVGTLALCGGSLWSSIAFAQTPAAPTSSATSPDVPLDPNAIRININGRNVASDPAPRIFGGAVYVPLRGVLEALGAEVNYLPALNRIDIVQGGQTFSLHPGQSGALNGTTLVPLAPAKMVGGRAFVPLRALAQLFGFNVGWQSAIRTVAISSKAGLALGPVDHRVALDKAGSVGVSVDFTAFTPEQVPELIAQAKASGATLLKFRFDWDTLEPQKGAAFNWPAYDRVVKAAREGGFTIVGVLGDSAQWASVLTTGDARVRESAPPRPDAYPSWSNYVRRVVGRYKNDVQAWQVWENPDASNFRSVGKTYRVLASLALDAARKSDPKALVHLAEPGAVNLNFLGDLGSNGLTSRFDGVSVYPVAGFQPNTLEAPESFLRPYASLRANLAPKDGKARDFWIGGVSFPASSDASAAAFSPRAQADYAVRALSLGLAASGQKAFYDELRDNPARANGRGLVSADGVARPAFGGVAALSKAVGNLPFAGALQADDRAVVLLFDNKREGAIVAWSPSGAGQLNLSTAGLPASAPNAVEVATRPDSQVLDSTGTAVAAPSGALVLSQSPVIITRVGAETAKIVDQVVLTMRNPARFASAASVGATFGKQPVENGISFRKYAGFGGQAQTVTDFDGKSGLTATPSTSVFDPYSARQSIYLDVDDDFLYDAPGVPVTVSVEVKRPPVVPQSVVSTVSGFLIEYDGAGGSKRTKWQVVEPGEGWTTMTFDLPDAQFADSNGYDLILNATGSRMPLTFGSVSIARKVADAPPAAAPPAG